MKYRWSCVWARVLGMLGVVIIGVGLGLAALTVGTEPVGLDSRSRALVAAACLVGSIVLGGSIIAAGQILDAFLDQRRLLYRIHRRLATWEQERREEAETRALRERGRSGRAG